MTEKEFVKGLIHLAKKHEKDEVSVFETNWSQVCKEAAGYISNLYNELKDKEEKLNKANKELNDWYTWYNENEAIIACSLKCAEKDEVDIPIFNKEPLPWNGVRNDIINLAVKDLINESTNEGEDTDE